MSIISRASLFAKLTPTAYKTVEGATVLCKLRSNPQVELAHWVMQILQLDDSDWHRIVRASGLDPSSLMGDLQRALERLPSGANSIRDLSDDLTHAVEKAWMYASLRYQSAAIRTGHVLVALLNTEGLNQSLARLSSQFRGLNPEHVAQNLDKLVTGSPEAADHVAAGVQAGAPGEASQAMPAASMGNEAALRRYTVDLTEKAKDGQIDPVTGRENEVRQMIDILLRRRQNNPLIAGEAGVGKTALVEGLALRLAQGDVPPALQGTRLLSLDLGLLQAGASMKGEFEQRLRQVVDEVQCAQQATILFIDEVHTLVGAGGAAGTGDAANLLKPALARGTLRTIGATTWSEFKKNIEKDPALTRRFQVIQVDEPSEALAVQMLRGLAQAMQKHHGVLIQDEAIVAAVKLSHRYIPARQLPDKAISLLDTACARVAVSQHTAPARVELLNARLLALAMEQDALEREQLMGHTHTERLAELAHEVEAAQAELQSLTLTWQQQQEAVRTLDEARQAVMNPSGEEAIDQAQLMSLNTALSGLQGEQPMVFAQVDEGCVAAVVADWTGIPVGRMVRNEMDTLLNLATLLGQRIVGQDHALELLARRVQTSRAGLDDPNKPVGVFMLAGSSGVGKTETALALAEALYGGEHNVITINMSEYQEAHTVSSLKGAPPGYVGYGEGGVLTEAVRRKPYSVVLLDEVEKAHPDVHELFFQVFDKGWMEDGEGRRIDFRNTLILLTTNVGTEVLMRACQQGAVQPPVEHLQAALRPALLEVFPPALLGRLDVVPYYPLSLAMLSRIVDLKLGQIVERIQRNQGLEVLVDPAVPQLVLARCDEAGSGGRVVGSILSNGLLPLISRQVLQRRLDGLAATHLTLAVEQQAFVCHLE